MLRSCLGPIVYSLLLIAGLTACGPKAQKPSSDVLDNSLVTIFQDVTEELEVRFSHQAGDLGNYFMPESVGSGGAFLDFDNDGRLDIYLVHNTTNSASGSNQLFHQQPDGQFRDVSSQSGLDVTGFGMGVAVGDVTNDGLPEVLLTEFGRARLFLNLGQGKFQDISETAGIDNTRWGTSASFFDYDRDGWLDLVIGNYVDYSGTVQCFDTRGAPEYCGPQGMLGSATRLFHHQGLTSQGLPRFQDVSVPAGIAKKIGPTLGVLCADLNGDQWLDILVADDGMANRLYINQKDGRFEEEAAQRGIAYNAFGATVANMGIAYGDVDGDGLSDIFITHVSWEQHALWKQGPPGLFLDQTAESGLSSLSQRGTAFGTVLVDLDLDGDLDLAFVNGRIKRGPLQEPFHPGLDPFLRPYAQRNQLFLNDGTGRFEEISQANPAFCGFAGVGRGLAYGDVDNDGKLDLLVVNAGSPAQLLRNTLQTKAHWLMVRAVDPALGGRDAYGAEIVIHAGKNQWSRTVQPGSSYLVSNDPRAHFGLGKITELDRIEVAWPDGSKEEFPAGPVDRQMTLSKGEGIKP